MQQHLPERFPEMIAVKRFADITIGTALLADRFDILAAGEHDDRCGRCFRVLFYFKANISAFNAVHMDIE